MARKLAGKWNHGAQTQSTTRFAKVACLECRRALVSVSSVKNTNKRPDLFDNSTKKKKIISVKLLQNKSCKKKKRGRLSHRSVTDNIYYLFSFLNEPCLVVLFRCCATELSLSSLSLLLLFCSVVLRSRTVLGTLGVPGR